MVAPLVPPAVQTLEGEAVSVTVNPDDAVTTEPRDNGPGICCGEEIAGKVMVCSFFTILTVF